MTNSNEITGWKWTMFAGFIPFMAGILMFLTTKTSVANEDAVWSFWIYSLNFSFADISAVDAQAGPLTVLLGDLAGVNIVSAALAVILISRYALRHGQKWAWWYLLFSLIWVGFNDAYGVTVFFLETGAPMLVMPWGFCILMPIGLLKTRTQVFR